VAREILMPFHRFKRVGTAYYVDLVCSERHKPGKITVGANVGGVEYSGSCDYEINERTLSIHTLQAKPEGEGLGAVLLLVAALQAFPESVERVETLATARNAYAFYLGIGLHPDNVIGDVPVFDMNTDQGKEDFNERLYLGRFATATWTGELKTLKDLAHSKLSRKWKYQEYFV
jgi:hypothetical protein